MRDPNETKMDKQAVPGWLSQWGGFVYLAPQLVVYNFFLTFLHNFAVLVESNRYHWRRLHGMAIGVKYASVADEERYFEAQQETSWGNGTPVDRLKIGIAAVVAVLIIIGNTGIRAAIAPPAAVLWAVISVWPAFKRTQEYGILGALQFLYDQANDDRLTGDPTHQINGVEYSFKKTPAVLAEASYLTRSPAEPPESDANNGLSTNEKEQVGPDILKPHAFYFNKTHLLLFVLFAGFVLAVAAVAILLASGGTLSPVMLALGVLAKVGFLSAPAATIGAWFAGLGTVFGVVPLAPIVTFAISYAVGVIATSVMSAVMYLWAAIPKFIGWKIEQTLKAEAAEVTDVELEQVKSPYNNPQLKTSPKETEEHDDHNDENFGSVVHQEEGEQEEQKQVDTRNNNSVSEIPVFE